jgi:hypothetical protein
MWFDATFDASIELKLQSGSVALTAQVIDSLGAASGSFVLGKTSKVSITGRAYATDLSVRAYYYYKSMSEAAPSESSASHTSHTSAYAYAYVAYVSTNTDAEDSLGAASDIQTDSVSMSPMSFARRLQAASPLESVLSDVKDSNMQVLRLS